jgi:hypothetical protein
LWLDYVISRFGIVPAGEEWLSVKTEPDFGLGGNNGDALAPLSLRESFWSRHCLELVLR